MSTALRAPALAACAVLFLPLAAGAASKPFTGPASGWDHTVAVAPAATSTRAQEVWKRSDGEVLVYAADGGLSFDDSIAAVKNNIAANHLRPAVAKDRTCDGRRAYELELTFDSTVVHQIIVDDAPGVTKLTYQHQQGASGASEALATLAAYCGS